MLVKTDNIGLLPSRYQFRQIVAESGPAESGTTKPGSNPMLPSRTKFNVAAIHSVV